MIKIGRLKKITRFKEAKYELVRPDIGTSLKATKRNL
jgi:hypothetical protein